MKKISTHKLIPKRSVGFLSRCGGMVLFLFTGFLVQSWNGQYRVSMPEMVLEKSITKTQLLIYTKSQLNQI